MSQDPSSAGVFIETYGCQMNQLDSELVAGQLELAGYQIVDQPGAATVVLLNTCSVRDLAEHKVWSRLGRLGEEKRSTRPELVIGVLGCMAEREAETIQRRAPYVDLICGATRLDRLPELLRSVRQDRALAVALGGHRQRRAHDHPPEDGLEALDAARSWRRAATMAQAYVRITRGCDKLCSFCVVPFTRGPEVHRPPEVIIAEVRRLAAAGVREVTLLGQTVNHYRHVDGRTTSFAELLAAIHDQVPELPRLRFVTSYPRDFDDETIAVLARSPRLCRYLHLPVQSGADRVLAAMNRGYTVADYLGLVERIRAQLPEVSLVSDMIVGFPGETEAEHQASLRLLETVRFHNAFVFKYSPRPGTVAARRYADDVPAEVKQRRNLELLELQNRIRLDHNRARIGQTVTVLVEGQSRLRQHRQASASASSTSPAARVRLIGRTSLDEIVAFDGPPDEVGTLVDVRISDATPLTLLGERPPPPA